MPRVRRPRKPRARGTTAGETVLLLPISGEDSLMSDRKHWDSVYATKGPDGVSWFRPHLDRSLAFLDAARIGHSARVIDVGGGRIDPGR